VDAGDVTGVVWMQVKAGVAPRDFVGTVEEKDFRTANQGKLGDHLVRGQRGERGEGGGGEGERWGEGKREVCVCACEEGSVCACVRRGKCVCVRARVPAHLHMMGCSSLFQLQIRYIYTHTR